jgi:hypothetical protein
MVLEAPRTEVRGGSIDGAVRGVDIRTATSVTGLRVAHVDQGVVVASTGIARLVDLDVNARIQSLRVEPGGMVEVEGSRLFPLSDEVAPTEGGWLPLAGVAAVTTGLTLEIVRWRRERRDLPSPAPDQIWNRS